MKRKTLIISLLALVIAMIYFMFFKREEDKILSYYEDIAKQNLPSMVTYLDSFPMLNTVKYSCYKAYDSSPEPSKPQNRYIELNTLPSEESANEFLKPFLTEQVKFVIFDYVNRSLGKHFYIVSSIDEYCKNYDNLYNVVNCSDTSKLTAYRNISKNCKIHYYNVKHCSEQRKMVDYSQMYYKFHTTPNGFYDYSLDIQIYLK